MSHIATTTYTWDFDHLPAAFIAMWEDHFRFLDPAADGLCVEIEYHYSQGTPGKTDGPPERCYPAEDPEVEIQSMIVTVPYSSPGAKAAHLDAYPPCTIDSHHNGDGLHCRTQPEFINAMLGAWEAWYAQPANERAVDAWLLEKAAANEDDMVTDALIDAAEARASYVDEY